MPSVLTGPFPRSALVPLAVAAMLVTALGGVCAGGQTDDADGRRLHLAGITAIGALRVDEGIDSNVFNTPDQRRQDFTTTLSPKTKVAARIGPTQLTGSGAADFVYFQRTASERSINVDGQVKLSLPTRYFEPYASAGFLRARQRLGFEVDARSLRRERAVSVGTTVRFSPITWIDVVHTVTDVGFDPTAVFLDTSLKEVFNRVTSTSSVSLRRRLTPLTTFGIAVDARDERFTYAPARDSTGVRVAPELEFEPSALVSGRASVGYRSFSGRDASMPAFRGPVASVQLAYTLLTDTRFELRANRDLEYSYEVTAPYYVLSGTAAEMVHALSPMLAVKAHVSRSTLNFQSLAGGGTGNRVEKVTVYGAGFIRKISRDLRVTATADYFRRDSPLSFRQYTGLQAVSSLVYGF